MSTFLLSYRDPKSLVLTAESVTAWSMWLDSLGDHIVDQGNPVREAQTLGSCKDDTVLGGFSLIDAADIDTAVALAELCPGLWQGGGVEVGRIFDLWPERLPGALR
jgi:hypothetical protein